MLLPFNYISFLRYWKKWSTGILSCLMSVSQHTFNTFVGGKLLGPTFLGSPTSKTVGVGVTFSLFLWKFCWTYRFWLPNSKNCWPFRTVVDTFDSFVGATFLTFVKHTLSYFLTWDLLYFLWFYSPWSWRWWTQKQGSLKCFQVKICFFTKSPY